MLRVAFAGAQDTGKTTLSRLISARLNMEGILCDYITEYARDHIKIAGAIEGLGDQYYTTERQIEREKLVTPKAKVMVTDSPVFLGAVYGLLLNKTESHHDQQLFNTLHALCLSVKYDVVFYLPPFHPVLADGTRPAELIELNPKIDKLVHAYLTLYCPHYITLHVGGIPQHDQIKERAARAMMIIKGSFDNDAKHCEANNNGKV